MFLTAAHCTAFLDSLEIPSDEIWVSFDQDVEPITRSTKLIRGEWVTNPDFNQRQSDPGDLAVDPPVEEGQHRARIASLRGFV